MNLPDRKDNSGRIVKYDRTMVTNVYDTNGRVSQQTLADGAIWQFAYT